MNEKKQIERIVEALKELGVTVLKPEDRLLIWLFDNGATGPEKAIRVPRHEEAAMYSLWIEDMVGHVGDYIYITPKGLLIVKALKVYFGVE